jgi:predicted nuclease of predicted toxin-antitoxin system
LKLLVDENQPPRLACDLADLFPGSAHVGSLSLSSTPDAVIWDFAKEHGWAFLTQDKDFANLSLARGAPPKVILLQTGNCSTSEIIRMIRNNAIRFAEFEGDARRGLLVLR